MKSGRVEPATTDDLDAIHGLLLAAGLPVDGLAEHIETALVVRDVGAVVGCVALELYDDAALLRSLAVAAHRRAEGIGSHLTAAALALARGRGVVAVYLLTMTAPQFFERKFSFRPVARDGVPDSVQGSVEFVRACPRSAQAMRRNIP